MTEPEKKRILIVNFTRMGDLIQSTPLIKGLKREHPHSELTLLALDDFRGICGGFPAVDRLLTFDVNYFLPRLEDSGISLEEHYTHLTKFMKRVGTSYDLVINLSHTMLSAALSFLTESDDVRGMALSDDGAQIIRHRWMNYFFNVSRNRLQNGINLVDMYNLTGDIQLKEKRVYYRVPYDAELYADEFLSGIKGEFIGFQLGASSKDRCWDPQDFGKLADILRSRLGYNIIILGTESEREKLEEMKDYCPVPVIDALGKTSMPQLAAVLQRCRLLVTNDTGTMHLAAAVGTGVVAVFLGEARPADTGPYTEKAVVLEANIPCAPCEYNANCLDHKCHRAVTPEHVLWSIQHFDEIASGAMDYMPDELKWSSLKFSRPIFEEDGFWNLIPIIKRRLTFGDFLKEIYRRMWKRFLCPDRFICDSDFTGYYFAPEDSDFAESVDKLESDLRELRKYAVKGISVAEELKKASSPPNIESLKWLTTKMILLDNGIYHLELTCPALAHIATTFRIRKKNTESGELDYISRVAVELYLDMCGMIDLLLDDIEFFADKVAPRLEAAL